MTDMNDSQRAKGWLDVPEKFDNAFLWIKPLYRGAERPEFGIRRSFGPVCAFDWSHDGGPDDIIGYRVPHD